MRENMSLFQRGIRAWLRDEEDEETDEGIAAGCNVAEFMARVTAFLTNRE